MVSPGVQGTNRSQQPEPYFVCLALRPQEDPGLTKTWKKTIKVAVTGASGQISNHLLFMVRGGKERAPGQV